MRRFTLVIAIAIAALVMTSCKAKEKLEKAEIKRDLEKRGTMDLLKEAAKDEYRPPADGHLTDNQVQMYIKVRDREREIAKVARDQMQKSETEANKGGDKSATGFMAGLQAIGSIADFATADIRAASDLGYNTNEYLWVKSKVLEVSAAEFTTRMADASMKTMEATRKSLQLQYDQAKDENTKKMLGEMLVSFETQKSEMSVDQDTSPELTHNRAVLAKYEDTLNAIASEWAKYENKEGETKEAVEKLENSLSSNSSPDGTPSTSTTP